MKKLAIVCIGLLFATSLCFAVGGADQSGNDSKQVTIEFMQWWEPENPGLFDSIIERFQKANPDIKINLISKPFSDIQQQVTIAAASGTLSDVVAMDPRWAYDVAKQQAVVPMDDYFKNDSKLNGKYDMTRVNGKGYVIVFQNFIYPLFYNKTYLADAGIANPPSTWSELVTVAKRVTNSNKDRYALAWGLNVQSPNNIQNDLLSYIWAMDGSVYPKFDTPANQEAFEFLIGLYKAGYIQPGALVAAEQDKVELFASGRVAMCVTSLAHINMINQRAPNLNYDLAMMPVKDGYNGKRNFKNAVWGLGISTKSKHKEQAWKFIQFLLQPDIATEVADVAHAFPGHKDSTVNWVNSNDLFKKAFNMYQQCGTKNESGGAPRASRLCGIIDEQLQAHLSGKQTIRQFMQNAQKQIDEIYAESAK